MVPKFKKWITGAPHDPLWPNLSFFSLELTAFRLRAKFELPSFNRSRDIGGRNIPKWVT